MNETPGPHPRTSSRQEPAAAGVDRQHLRSYEQLRRSVTDRKIAGVAGGLGRHLNIDPTVLRVLFVVLCFFGGAGLRAVRRRVAAGPRGRAGRAAPMHTSPATRNGLLIAAGVVAALLWSATAGAASASRGRCSWSASGWCCTWCSGTGRRALGGPPGATTAARRCGPAAARRYAAARAPCRPARRPRDVRAPGRRARPPPAPPPAAGRRPTSRRARKRGPRLFGITLALVALALGTLGLYDVAGGGAVPTPPTPRSRSPWSA